VSTLELEKYEGLGNDFLIAIDARGDFEFSAERPAEMVFDALLLLQSMPPWCQRDHSR
jgi:hypothetical protein